MKKNIQTFALSIFVSLYLISASISAEVPEDLIYSITFKLAELDENISQKEHFSIYVLGPKKTAEKFQSFIGKKAGKAELKLVDFGNKLPEKKYCVLFVDQNADVNEIAQFTQEKNIMSVTSMTDQVAEGISFGIGLEDGKPKVIINIASAKQEGLKLREGILELQNLIMELKTK